MKINRLLGFFGLALASSQTPHVFGPSGTKMTAKLKMMEDISDEQLARVNEGITFIRSMVVERAKAFDRDPSVVMNEATMTFTGAAAIAEHVGDDLMSMALMGLVKCAMQEQPMVLLTPSLYIRDEGGRICMKCEVPADLGFTVVNHETGEELNIGGNQHAGVPNAVNDLLRRAGLNMGDEEPTTKH